jgi:endonuclease III
LAGPGIKNKIYGMAVKKAQNAAPKLVSASSKAKDSVSETSLQEKYDKIVAWFSEHSPDPKTELQYSNPYELIVAVSLSAQCTDKRVNLVTPRFFERFPTPETLAIASKEEVFSYISSISYPNNKSANLIGMAKLLTEQYHSVVPSSVDELVKLPGVGRKTANVIASVVFGQAAMAVDTHVFRVAHRLGLVPETAKTPEAVERTLVAYLPEAVIAHAHHWLILHGRYVCLARKPSCNSCALTKLCNYFEINNF